MDNEEKARGQVTGELRIKKTQHMTTSRYHPLPSLNFLSEFNFIPHKNNIEESLWSWIQREYLNILTKLNCIILGGL